MLSKKIKIHVWHTGMVLVDSAIPFRNTSSIPWGIGRGRRHKVLLPVSSYFIEHPKGNILIDTGWPESVRKSPQLELGLTTFASKPSLPFNWSVREHLSAINIVPSQIDYVLLSHLDTDHVGGLQLVKNAKKFITSSIELQATQKPSLRYCHNLWENINIQGFEYTKNNIGPLGYSYDLFDDGTILIVATPGHTKGLSSVIVTNADNKFVILASDVGYDKKNLNENILPGILTNIESEMNSLMWVKKMSQSSKCQEVLFNHDNKIFEKEIIF